jgi:23S rRNA pseudouridine1911/1915/1917 synthase
VPITITVPKESNEARIDRSLPDLVPNLSRKAAQKLIDEGLVFLNKRRIWMRKFAVKTGDTITIQSLNPGQSTDKTPQKLAKFNLEIISENEDFLIINKPAGYSVEKNKKSTTSPNTIFDLIKHSKLVYPYLELVHRLDKDTSGVLVLAKNFQTQAVLDQLFKERKVYKEYLALCFNSPSEDEGQINYALRRDEKRDNAFKTTDSADGKVSRTDYKVLKVYGDNSASKLLCIPKTGRSHQIRVHLAAINCPILGDKTYSSREFQNTLYPIARRQMLHAQKVSFVFKDKEFTFNAPVPNDFIGIEAQLDKYNANTYNGRDYEG